MAEYSSSLGINCWKKNKISCNPTGLITSMTTLSHLYHGVFYALRLTSTNCRLESVPWCKRTVPNCSEAVKGSREKFIFQGSSHVVFLVGFASDVMGGSGVARGTQGGEGRECRCVFIGKEMKRRTSSVISCCVLRRRI